MQRKKPKVLTKNLIETKVYHIMSKLLYQRMRRLAFVLPTEVYLPHHFVFRKRPLIFTVKEITSNHSTTHGTVLNESPRCTGVGVVDVRKSFKTHNVPSSVSQDKNWVEAVFLKAFSRGAFELPRFIKSGLYEKLYILILGETYWSSVANNEIRTHILWLEVR